jgi:DNA-binding MarR family transcriptional regulator
MKNQTHLLIKRYTDVYLFATKRIDNLIKDRLLEDLSLEQFSVLRHIYLNKSIRSSELAELCCVNKSAISLKVDKLFNKNLIVKHRDSFDRRNVDLSLSEEGKSIYLQVEKEIEQFVEPLLNELTSEELNSFLNVYEKISQIIQRKKREEVKK